MHTIVRSLPLAKNAVHLYSFSMGTGSSRCVVAGRPDIAAPVRRSGPGLVVYYSERSYTEQKSRATSFLISTFR